MGWQELLVKLGVVAAEKAPGIVENMVKRKEEKNLFVTVKSWIFIIILSIFATKLEYINIFDSIILNSIINIIFGIIVLVLFWVFLSEEKDIFKSDSKFIKVLMISLIILGIINFFYHVGYAISKLLTLIL